MAEIKKAFLKYVTGFVVNSLMPGLVSEKLRNSLFCFTFNIFENLDSLEL